MQVSSLKIENFRNIKNAELSFDGHTLLVGQNNVGKSTVFEALELALGPDRQARFPVVEEFDFYNAGYLDENEVPIPIRIEVLLTDVTPTVERTCFNYLERWNPADRRILGTGEIEGVDDAGLVWCLRLLTVARYNKDEDEFEAGTYYATAYDPEDEPASRVPRSIRRNFGFLYLRTLRTGSRALSLERGSLLDVILRIQSLKAGIWETCRRRLQTLEPPIEEGATSLTPILQNIEARLAEYIEVAAPGDSTRLFVSQLTREHLRKTLSFFISLASDQQPVPFHLAGTGTLNTLVLALLSFIAELKEENVIFAMEEPEIALPPHTQRRIASYLLTKTTQCFVTTHSPYVIECFDPEQIVILRRDDTGAVRGTRVELGSQVKAKTYRRYVRRGFAEAILGRGVVIAEGITEQLALLATAEALERADAERYPLDLAGITVMSADGDGSIAELGRFFASLDLPVFAFLDKRVRPKKEQDALNNAGFLIVNESAYDGMEALLAQEVPVDRQWEFLERLRDDGLVAGNTVPTARPSGNDVKALTECVLKAGKGAGRAAALIGVCPPDELPAAITTFLDQLYSRFPRPKLPEPLAPVAEEDDAGADDAETPPNSADSDSEEQ